MRPIGELIEAALAHHRAGRLDEAERIYRQILKAGHDHHATHIARIRLATIAFDRAHGRLREDVPDLQRPLAIFYRISSMSRAKDRFADKRRCLANFLAVFTPGPTELTVIADHCDDATMAMIEETQARCGTAAKIERTGLGNAASWRRAMELALTRPDDMAIYFVEDDFLHRPGARQALAEGLSRADYVSLYDHPDKYVTAHPAGNPIVEAGGEVARVIRTRLSHWKTTNSTTMTFATTRAVLAADRAVWDNYTKGVVPYDFQAFVSLTAGRRSLIVPTPAFATHGETAWLAPGVDWNRVP